MKNEDLRFQLENLLTGATKPSKIVGRGKKNARMLASCFLRLQIHNIENPTSRVSDVYINSDGSAFRSIESAKRSKVFMEFTSGTHSESECVKEFGVIPAPGEDGFMVYAIKQSSNDKR